MDRFQVNTIAGNGNNGFKDGKALEAMFYYPGAICCSKDGRLYVSDNSNHRIRMIYNNKVTTITGNGTESCEDGNALEAAFDSTWGICTSQDGIIYMTEYNYHRIRMIHNNRITTIAGNGKKGCKDGNALEAMFYKPSGICCSKDGILYVSDTFNNRIRIMHNTQVNTIAGNGKKGFKDGNALEAMFFHPQGICFSVDGKIYVADQYNYRIRMIYNKFVTTIAGNDKQGFKDGNALEAMFHYPTALCISKDGKLYISDYMNHRVRVIYNNQVTTIAGNGQYGFQDGNALEAMFYNPMGMCCSDDGRLYISDTFNNRIRMIYDNQYQKSPFGFALLLDMKNTFSDCQISFNNINYHLHSTLINVRCPLLFDQSYFSLLQQSNISNKSFESFVIFLYSNTFTNQYNQTWKTTLSIKEIVEQIFMIELLMNGCRSILRELESSFTKQLIEMLTINQQQSMNELIVDFLPRLYNLKELIKSKDRITTNSSYIEHCYNILARELQQKKSTIEQYVTQLQHNLSDESYTNIMNDMMSQATQIDTMIDDESMIDIGADLTEISKLAFYKTNICKMQEIHNDNKSTLESSSISTQHLNEWTTPDFVIKLSNDDISYHVHKLILCGRWKYFCLMIESGLKEVSDNEMILSDDWNKSRFEKMMKYIYLNEIEFESLEDVEWLMENRKLYGITVDKERNQGDDDHEKQNESIEEDASYGFEDLHEYCIGVFGTFKH